MKKSEEGQTYIVKTMKLTGDTGAAEIGAKKEEVKKRRSEKNKLRRKMGENPAEPKYINTEIGVGYRMREE